jgi:hypothetical protein
MRSSVYQYLGTLYKLRDRIGLRVEKAEVKVSGHGSFLYAVHADRAIELYTGDEGWWIEYWGAEDAPVRDEVVPDPEQAIQNVQAWLLAARA